MKGPTFWPVLMAGLIPAAMILGAQSLALALYIGSWVGYYHQHVANKKGA